MPKDAKLGLVVGVALVIVIGVLFYHNHTSADAAGNLQTAPTRVSWLGGNPVPGLPLPLNQGVRSHKVQEGETLASIAVRYYGDAAYSSFLFRANRSQLRAPDHVTVGTVLLIPELPGLAARITR
jgi:nucleoid-associated protein YgaU